MESGPQAQGDILQVIPRRTPSGAPPPGGGGTGSRRISLPPERRRALTRVVFAALGTCGVILVAAGIAHLLRPTDDTAAFAAIPTAATPPAPAAVPANPPAATAVATPPVPDTPQTGTLRLQNPAAPGKVWLDGQKITAASATVACGEHQLKVGRAKAHAITIPCGGDLKIAR